MGPWTVACIVIAVLSFVQAVLTLHLNPRATLNRAVALMALSYSFWVFWHGLTLDVSPEGFWLTLRITLTLRILCVVTPLAVILLMAGVRGIRFWLVLALPLAVALLELVPNWTGVLLVSGFHQGPWGRVLEEPPGSFWPVFHAAEHQLILVAEAALLVRVWRLSRARRVRRILEHFVAAGIAANVLAVGLVWGWRTADWPDLSPLAWFLIVLNYYVLVVRYQHLTDSQPDLAGLVFRFLNVRSLLADEGGRVLFVSQELLSVLGLPEARVRGRTVFGLFPGWPDLESAWTAVRESHQPCRGLGGSVNRRRFHLSLVPRRDHLGDLDGIVVILEPLWDWEAAVRRFGISARESEVAELLIQAHTMAEIAARLFISPPTVKNHIHRLLEKTGARNRVELVRLLTSEAPLPVGDDRAVAPPGASPFRIRPPL